MTNIRTTTTQLASIGSLLALSATMPGAGAPVEDDGVNTIEIMATVRDFRAYDQEGGHPDFQRWTGDTRVGLVERELGDDGKPVLADRHGWHIVRPYRHASGFLVDPFLAMDGEESTYSRGRMQQRHDARITSESSFHSWYRDTPGVNISTVVPLTLHETEPGSGVFEFDSHSRASRERHPWLLGPVKGFFPINGQGFGNYRRNTNYHFTTEIVTEFTYEEGAGWTFHFSGDDDVWVFIGGELAIDLGGVHPARRMAVALDDLDWLDDGETYTLHVFHAERRTTQSNFKIQTTIPLRGVPLAPVTAAFD